MDDPPILDPVAQVLAWHNRHPLARRIAPEHVTGVGVVSLPFVAADDVKPAAWKRWLQPLLQRLGNLKKKRAFAAPALKPAFSEQLVDGISPQRLALFALRHGSPQNVDSALMLRELPANPEVSAESILRLYLSTAAVESGPQLRRVLIGSGQTPEILGGRVWDRLRLGMAAALLCVVIGLPVGIWLGSAWGTSDATSEASMAAAGARVNSASSGAVASPEPAPGPEPEASAVALADPPASAASMAAAAVASSAASRPASEPAAMPAPELAAVPNQAASRPERPVALPRLTAEERAQALQQAAALRSQLAGPTRSAPASAASEPSRTSGKASKAISEPLPLKPEKAASMPGKVYALVGSLTGTRAASERRLHLMGLSFAGKKMSGELRGEIMKVDKGWRATLWPFASRAEAEAARDKLAEEGVYSEVLGF
jgi:hypothetical protein